MLSVARRRPPISRSLVDTIYQRLSALPVCLTGLTYVSASRFYMSVANPSEGVVRFPDLLLP